MSARTAKHLVQVLLQASEKSAQIARAWRCQKDLFELMVEEKTEKHKNKRFVRDFKTLADVLVQEVVKHDVSREAFTSYLTSVSHINTVISEAFAHRQEGPNTCNTEVSKNFPELSGFILGEESNKFKNSAGEEIRIEVKDDISATSKHLVTVLDGNESAALLLADIIHAEISLGADETQALEDKLDFELPLDQLGIWIDPIDCTTQYMSNSPGEAVDGIVVSGLPCAAVLIGVFHRRIGAPVAGVINQPFSTVTEDKQNNQQWKGRRLWGVTHYNRSCYFLGNDHKSIQDDKDSKNSSFKIAVSGSENEDIKKTLLSLDANIFTISGVGHKLLQVIDGNVDFYILSHPSSFKWDTCAAHAILCAMGGEVVTYNEAISLKSTLKDIDETSLMKCRLKYHVPDEKGQKWSNSNGLIAFQSFHRIFNLLEHLG